MTSITFDDKVNQDLENLNKVRNLRCMQALNSELSGARALAHGDQEEELIWTDCERRGRGHTEGGERGDRRKRDIERESSF